MLSIARTQAVRATAPIARRNTAVGQKRGIVDWMVNYPDKVRDTYLEMKFELSLKNCCNTIERVCLFIGVIAFDRVWSDVINSYY